MQRPLLKANRKKKKERGIAMVLSLFLMLTMSIVASSLMFLAQTETYSTANYRMMSQARYGAESGIQLAANYLLYTYSGAAPSSTNASDLISNYNMTVSPVTYNGSPVILSANDNITANYPNAATRTAFAALKKTLALGTTNVSSVKAQPYATLMSMEDIPASAAKDGNEFVVQTWLITSDGSIANSPRNTQVEVSAIIETQKLSLTQTQTTTTNTQINYGAFATAATCGALSFSGGASTKSYNSAALSGGAPVVVNANGNVGTNGNLTESGGVTINGTLSSPRVGVGSCSSGNVDAETTSGGATVTGGLVHLPAALTLPTPAITAPTLTTPSGTLNITGSTTCASIVATVPAANCSGSAGALVFKATPGVPLVLGSVSISGGASKLTLASDPSNSLTYNINSLSTGGSGSIGFGSTGASSDKAITVNAQTITTGGGGAVPTVNNAVINANTISLASGIGLNVQSQAQVTVNVGKSFSTSGAAKIDLPADSGLSTQASLHVNVATDGSVTTPLDFSGGTVTNNGYDASRMVFQYGGTGNVNMSGGTKQAVVVYAPNAKFNLSGGASLYGEVVASTVTDSGGTVIYYDTNLQNKGVFGSTTTTTTVTDYYADNPMLSSFSWKKY